MILVERVEDYKNIFEGKQIISVDCETTGLCPFQNELRLVQISSGDETLVFDVFKLGREATTSLIKEVLEDVTVIKILHNAKFDLKFLRQQLGINVERIFDSYLASVLIEAGIRQPKGYHGLGQSLKRYCDIEISKAEQVSDWSGKLSESQLAYAVKDVESLFPLREELIIYLKKNTLTKAAKLEFDAVLPMAWLELSGFYLNLDDWTKVSKDHAKKAVESEVKILAELSKVIEQGSLFGEPIVNLNSHVQIKKYFRMLGVPMPDSTKEFLLTPLTKSYPIVQWLLDYRGHIKASNTFGEAYRQFVNPTTGRIHANFFQIGAETGRLSVSNPNLNQIPSDKEHRNCFQTEKGNSLISADFSQEELRILADFSRDKKFINMFESGEDFHTATAANLFHIPLTKVGKTERDLAKRLNFGLTYGIGAKKFALNASIPESEAALIIRNYFNSFKGVDRWLRYQKVKVLETKLARTASGRTAIYQFDADDGKERSAAQRNACNMPIQGTAADILKRAMRVLYDNTRCFGDKVKLVNVVHDEINLEAPDDIAEEISVILHDAMKQAASEYIQKVPIKVDIGIMKKWEK